MTNAEKLLSNETSDKSSDRWLNRTVLGAGITSALGDFCYETTTVLLPGFMAVLGIPAAALGLIEGFAEMASSLTKMFAGFVADKLGHRKALVLLGYGLTPAGQVLIALAVGWPLILIGRLVSWIGKGLRGPLRDAIVIQSVTARTRGRAFGFHRAMDTLGAVVGPLLGVALLGWTQGLGWSADGAFRFVFWLSVIPGILAVIAFLVLVRDPSETPNQALRLFSTLRDLPRRFRTYLGAVAIFGLGDFSHSLLVLAATQLLAPSLGLVEAAQAAGLLYVARNVVQVLASFPAGALADRFGSKPVLVSGYATGAATSALAAFAFWFDRQPLFILGAVFFLAGIYVAIQEALESTVTAEMVDAETLATSYGALGVVNGVTKFASSAGLGLLWTIVSPIFGFGLAASLMVAGTIFLAAGVRSRPA